MRINEVFTPDQMMILVNKLNQAINDGAIKIDFNYNTETRSFSIGYWKDYVYEEN